MLINLPMILLMSILVTFSLNEQADYSRYDGNRGRIDYNSPQSELNQIKEKNIRILSSPYDSSIYECSANPSQCCYTSNITIKAEKIIRHVYNNFIKINFFVQALGCDMKRIQTYFTNLFQMSIVPFKNYGFNMNDYDLNNSFPVDTSFYIWEVNKKIKMNENIFSVHCHIRYNRTIESLNNTSLVFFSNNSLFQNSSFFGYNPLLNSSGSSGVFVELEDPHNKVPIQFFEREEYLKYQMIMHAFLGIMSINFLFLIISVCIKKSAIAFQSIMIVEFMYYLIVSLQKIQFPTTMLAANGAFLTGSGSIFTIPIFLYHNRCPNMDKIYKECNALNDINLSFYLATILLIISLFLLIHKRKKQRKLQKQSNTVRISQINETQVNEENKNYFAKPQQEFTIENETKRNEIKIYRMSKCSEFFLSFCLELSFSLYFIITFDYFLIAYNQKSQYITESSFVMVGLGFSYVLLWFVWFFFYPLENISYVRIMNVGKERLSIGRYNYLIMFLFLLTFGIMVTATSTIVACGFMIGFTLLWAFLVLFKNIYRTTINKIRVLLNQVFIISIGVVFIFLSFKKDRDFAFICSIILLGILYASSISNVIFCIIDIKTDTFYDEVITNTLQDDVKQINEETRNYATVIIAEGDRVRPKLKQFEMLNPRRDLLFDESNNKQTLESQKKNLNGFKKQLKINNENKLTDEVKAEHYNTLYGINIDEQEQQI